jgi:hypothetical protein
VPTELKLQEITLVIETLVNVQWELIPEVDSRSGFKMVVLAPEDVNFDMLAQGLHDAGYHVVI